MTKQLLNNQKDIINVLPRLRLNTCFYFMTSSVNKMARLHKHSFTRCKPKEWYTCSKYIISNLLIIQTYIYVTYSFTISSLLVTR